MISYKKIQDLITREMVKNSLSLRQLSERIEIDYGTLWRLLKAENNEQVFEEGKGRKGKVIMNLTASTLDKLCGYFKCQPGELLKYKR